MSYATAYMRRVQCQVCAQPARAIEAVHMADGYYHPDCLRKALRELTVTPPDVQFRFF